MYISGCIGFIPKTMEIIGGGVEAEASQALINMGAILKAAGCTHKNVVKTTVLLKDIKDFAAVNEIYKKFFTSHYPARAAYQVQLGAIFILRKGKGMGGWQSEILTIPYRGRWVVYDHPYVRKKCCVTFQKGKSDIEIKYDLFQKGYAEANALLSSPT